MPGRAKTFATLAGVALTLALSPAASLAQTATEGAAQETTEPAAQAAPDTAAEQPAATPDGLSLGEPVDDGARKPGDTYIREEIGDWALRCVVVEQGEDRCQLYQLLSDDQGQPIAEFALLKLPEGGQAQAAATIIVPLETSLQNQLSIQVDTQPGKRYPFAFCNQIGCYARIGLTPDDVVAFRRGSAAEISIVPIAAPDVRVTVELSLSGFTAAFDKVETAAPGN